MMGFAEALQHAAILMPGQSFLWPHPPSFQIQNHHPAISRSAGQTRD